MHRNYISFNVCNTGIEDAMRSLEPDIRMICYYLISKTTATFYHSRVCLLDGLLLPLEKLVERRERRDRS